MCMLSACLLWTCGGVNENITRTLSFNFDDNTIFDLHLCAGQRVEDMISDFLFNIHYSYEEEMSIKNLLYDHFCSFNNSEISASICDSEPPREIVNMLPVPSPTSDIHDNQIMREFYIRRGYHVGELSRCYCLYHGCSLNYQAVIEQNIEIAILQDQTEVEKERNRQKNLYDKYMSICLPHDDDNDKKDKKDKVLGRLSMSTGHGQTSQTNGNTDDDMMSLNEKVFFIRRGFEVNATLNCVCQHVHCDSHQRENLFKHITDVITRSEELEATSSPAMTASVVTPTTDTTTTAASPGHTTTEIGISLGSNCQAAVLGVQEKLRLSKAENCQTGPFDIGLFNYNGVVECLLDEFKYFTDSNYLRVIEVQETFGHYKKGMKIIYNARYRFIFNHEGWEAFSENDFYYFKKRYNRRIQNFFNYIKNAISQETIINFLVATTVQADEMKRLQHAINTQFGELRGYRLTTFQLRSYVAEQEASLVNLTVADIIH